MDFYYDTGVHSSDVVALLSVGEDKKSCLISLIKKKMNPQHYINATSRLNRGENMENVVAYTQTHTFLPQSLTSAIAGE